MRQVETLASTISKIHISLDTQIAAQVGGINPVGGLIRPRVAREKEEKKKEKTQPGIEPVSLGEQVRPRPPQGLPVASRRSRILKKAAV